MSIAAREVRGGASIRAGVLLAGLVLLDGCGPILTHGSPLSSILADQAATNAASYRLQAGDQLEVHHVLDSDFSAVVTVAPDGRITLPGIEAPVLARDQTVDELTDQLNGLYKQTSGMKTPFFSLNLRSFANLQVFVGGEVLRPGYLELTGGRRSLLQVIMAGGGFMNTARAHEVIVLRTQRDGSNRIFSVDLTKVLSGEDLSQNVLVQPMDVVFVPKTDIASLDIWVDQYIRQALPVQSSASVTLTNQGLGQR